MKLSETVSDDTEYYFFIKNTSILYVNCLKSYTFEELFRIPKLLE